METPQDQQPVRRGPYKEESGRPIIDMDDEGALWSGVLAARRRPSNAPGRDVKDNYGDQSQKGPKIEDRQTGRHSSGVTTEQIDDYGNHFFLRTRLPPP